MKFNIKQTTLLIENLQKMLVLSRSCKPPVFTKDQDSEILYLITELTKKLNESTSEYNLLQAKYQALANIDISYPSGKNNLQLQKWSERLDQLDGDCIDLSVRLVEMYRLFETYTNSLLIEDLTAAC